MNPLTNVRNVTKLSQRELEGHHGKTSWHDEYRESAWVFAGGMPYDLTEGDVLTIFSQWGEIVNINMVRDKVSGKFKGFGFICYENQKSTILAVDNFNGIKILGRTLRVDHVKDYKPPKDSDKLDDITRQLYEQGCAPQVAEDRNSRIIDGYELLDDDEGEDRDDGAATHSVLKGLANSSSSKPREREEEPSTPPPPRSDSIRSRERGERDRGRTALVEPVKNSKSLNDSDNKDNSKSSKRSHSHKSKKSKKKHSKSKDSKKKKKHRRHSSSSSSSDSSDSESDSDSSPDRRRSKRDSSPHAKKRRR